MAADIAGLTKLRREFHRFPELGFEENRTKSRVAKLLRGFGLEVHQGAGVVGVLKAGNGNRAIGLRADMDALPIIEESRHDYSSKNTGVMHACGHDGHMTMLLGAAGVGGSGGGNLRETHSCSIVKCKIAIVASRPRNTSPGWICRSGPGSADS